MAKAHFAERVIALVIDAAVLVVACLALGLVTGTIVGTIGNLAGNEDLRQFLATVWLLMIASIPLLYWPYFWIGAGQTPGMMVMKIRVVAVDGSRVMRIRALLRYFVFLVSWIACGLGLLWALFDHNCQGWHDKIAGTYVVSA